MQPSPAVPPTAIPAIAPAGSGAGLEAGVSCSADVDGANVLVGAGVGSLVAGLVVGAGVGSLVAGLVVGAFDGDDDGAVGCCVGASVHSLHVRAQRPDR